MKTSLKKCIFIVSIGVFAFAGIAASSANAAAKQFKYSTTVEKERPQLNEATRKLIAAYRANPTAENLAALRKQVETNYDAVIARKKAKLDELRRTAKHSSKIAEMQEIVDEVVKDRENRIEQSMRRFTDPRLKPDARKAVNGYLPVLGAAENVFIAYAPVTNEEFAKFVKATGAKAPKDWAGGIMPADKAKHPVVNVSFETASAYCKWLSKNDKRAVYRLPTETEWEYAAGHMPKDADFNCGERNSTSPVDAYAKTLSACGAVDMWGNCWEMVSAERNSKTVVKLKGGSWRSSRMDCRTEVRNKTVGSTSTANDVGFRVVRQTK